MSTKPLKLRLLASEIAHIANIAMREGNEQPLGQAIAYPHDVFDFRHISINMLHVLKGRGILVDR